MPEYMGDILKWYLFLSMVGLLGFVLSVPLFKNLKDFGYSLSKILGLLVVSYFSWIVPSLPFFNIGFSRILILFILLIFALVLVFVVIKYKPYFNNLLQSRYKFIIIFEIVSFTFFMLLIYFRSLSPDITGASKIADLAIIQGILKANYFPPDDIFLSGYTLNYFYFGHLCFALPIQFLNIDPAVGFNLIPPTIILFVATSIFGLVYSLTSRIFYGLLAIYSAIFMSNFEPVSQIFHKGLKEGFNWWNNVYFPGNYFIEFPYYSFLLGQVHTNFLFLPFLGLFLCLLYVAVKERYLTITGLPTKGQFCIILLLGLILSCSWMINPWGFWVMIAFLGLFILFSIEPTLRSIGFTAVTILIYTLLIIGLNLPFHFHYQAIVGGFEVLPLHLTTKISDFFLIMGPYILLIIVSALPFLYTIFKKHLFKQMTGAPEGLKNLGNRPLETDFVIKTLLICCLMIIFAEVFYIEDTLIDSPKMLTASHVYMDILLILAVITAFFISKISKKINNQYLKDAYFTFCFIVLSTGLIFVYFGTGQILYQFNPSSYGREDLPSVNGLSYILQGNKGEAFILEFIKDHVPKNSVILEGASGGDRDYFGRIAAFTGLNTIVAWDLEQEFYRGRSVRPLLDKRINDVDLIYKAQDKATIRNLIDKYSIDYIYVGSKGVEKYGDTAKAFESIGKKIVEHQGTVLYKVR